MSSKKAMKQAQKQAYAKHRSNITDNRFSPTNNRFDLKNKKVQYSGAFRPLIKINGENIEVTKGDRYPIGGGSSYVKDGFTTHEFDINKGDCFFMFSDGFPDQFGGPKDKKFMNKKFKALLQEIQSLSPKEQIFRLNSELENWRGETEQVDDVLVIGVCF